MERKISEIFTYNDKTYQVVKGITCNDCALRDRCYLIRKLLGPCIGYKRTDETSVIFKEVKKQMEIKNNQLIIDIPERMEIDTENSNLAKGIIKFKSKYTTYDNIVNSFSSISRINVCIHSSNIKKLIAMAQLMNIAKYHNKDWKPSWISPEQPKYYIYYNNKEDRYKVNSTARINLGDVYFKHRDNAQSVIDNPNFKSILDAIYKD